VAGEHGNPDTGAGDRQFGIARILRLSLRYFCSSSVSSEPSSTMANCSGMTLWAIGAGYTENGG